METWMSQLPLLQVGYSSEYQNAVIRTNFRGKKTQRRTTQRHVEIASAELVLFGAQLPLFEYFVQVRLSEGQDYFTGSFINNGTVSTGAMRIVGGAYTVSAITKRDWRISFDLEFRRD